MEFTEVSEINEMIQHSKSLNSSSALEFGRNQYPKAHNDSLDPIAEEFVDDNGDHNARGMRGAHYDQSKQDPFEILSNTLKLDEEEILDSIIEDIRSIVESSQNEEKSELEHAKEGASSHSRSDKDGANGHPKDHADEVSMIEEESHSSGSNEGNADSERASERKSHNPSKTPNSRSSRFEKIQTPQAATLQPRRSLLSQSMKEQPVTLHSKLRMACSNRRSTSGSLNLLIEEVELL